jgi:hypothetical protein
MLDRSHVRGREASLRKRVGLFLCIIIFIFILVQEGVMECPSPLIPTLYF